MTDNSSLIARQSPAALYLFLDAMRCWGAARRAGQPALVRLHARLGRHGWAQLLPAIDSLLDLSEARLGRRLRLGRGPALSDDEKLSAVHAPAACQSACLSPREPPLRQTPAA